MIQIVVAMINFVVAMIVVAMFVSSKSSIAIVIIINQYKYYHY